MRLRLAIVVLAAALPAVAAGAVQKTVLGTAARRLPRRHRRAPTGSWRAAATTGSPLSTTAASTGSRAERGETSSSPTLATGSTADCEVVSRRIHRDRHANAESQHESEVEPDSQTVGQTTVAVFQVGRNRTGGAASIGFSTSKDGGRTWREGTPAGTDHEHDAAWAIGARERSGGRLRRGARRLAREHARDRGGCDAV